MILNWQSFRCRTALLSAALAGSALVGFGLISWWLIRDAKLDQLDTRLTNQVMRTAALLHRHERRPQRPDNVSQSTPNRFNRHSALSPDWALFESFIPFELGINDNVPVAILITNRDGHVLYQSETWRSDLQPEQVWDTAPLFPNSAPTPSDSPPPDRPFRIPPKTTIATQQTTGGLWRVGGTVSPDVRVAIAVSLEAVNQEMAVIRNLFLITIPAVLALIAIGAWLLSGRALRPIRRLTHTIQQVTAQGLNQRVPSDRTDVEFVELVQVFNQMLERLERSFHQALRFSGDAAHELKTPLAILQGELEQTIQHLEDGSPLQQTLSHLLDEVRRLSGIVRKLLLLSLADAGQMQLHYVHLDLSELLHELVDDVALLAPELTVKTEVAPYLRLQGDRDLLTQVLQNLISNAIKYNLPSGWIHILAQQQGADIQMTIRNASAGIATGDRDRIFDRFHRGDPARTRKVEGVGLGLSLAREIVRTHGGTLALDVTPPGETSFTLILPIAQNKAASVL